MQLTHFGHSCLLVQTASARLLIDPGSYSAGFEALRELTAVLITHQHPDHLDVERLPDLLAANPDAELITDSASAKQLTDRGITARVTGPGERLELGSSTVEPLGGQHAMIHPEIPVVPNNAYLIDGALLHPGDSFHVPPDRPVEILGVPTGAPWLKAREAVDYLRAVSPRVAVPIHEGVLARPQMVYGLFERLAPSATTVKVLERGAATAL
jgi:L-ascorbate metabolism protein UlaG (beta-lactamase superfamily)